MRSKEYVPEDCDHCPFCAQEEGGYYPHCQHYDEYLDWSDGYVKGGKADFCKVTKIIVEEK